MRSAASFLLLASSMVLAAPGSAQTTAQHNRHLRAELVRSGSDLRLTVEPREGWHIISADDTLTGRPFRVAWEGAVPVTQPPAGASYILALDTARVYDARIEMKGRALQRSVSARLDYIACRDVCEPGTLVLRLRRQSPRLTPRRAPASSAIMRSSTLRDSHRNGLAAECGSLAEACSAVWTRDPSSMAVTMVTTDS